MRTKLYPAPRIGMGCWPIAGPFWQGDRPVGYAGSDDARSIETLDAAWAAGIRVFDTAAVYGAGHAETLLGQTLGNRAEAIIISKFGHDFDAETKQMTGPRHDPASIRASIDQSRKRLRRDRVDVILLHLNTLPIEAAGPVFDTLEELLGLGRIGAYGWSTDFPASVRAMAGRDGFVAVEHAMNLFFDAPSICEAADHHDLVQLIRSPLAMGLLTGSFALGRRVPADDVRRGDDDLQGYFQNGMAAPSYARQLDDLRDLLTVGGRTLAQGALCWLLARSSRALPIPGARLAKQAEENAAAMAFGPLPASIMADIEAILQRAPEGPPRER